MQFPISEYFFNYICRENEHARGTIMHTHTFSEYGMARIQIYKISGSIDLEAPLKIQNYHLIILSSGEMTADVNFKIFNMRNQSSLHISAGDSIRHISASKDITGYHIVFSSEFQT